MNYYEKNMESIKEYREYLYECLNDTEVGISSNLLDEISSVTAKDGGTALVIKQSGVEYRLNSVYRPREEATRWAEQYQLQGLNNLISMFGLGNGMFVRAIIEKMGKEDILVIYEASVEIFKYVLVHYDISDIISNPRIVLSVENINEFEYHNTLHLVINLHNLSKQVFCIHPYYDKLFPESCKFFWQELKDSVVRARTNINTTINFGKPFIENILNNSKYLGEINSLPEFYGKIPKDIPAIIVAAGPSVEEQINELKGGKRKGIIFAVDRILDYLLDNGIEPDFVVTLDAIKPIEYFSKRTDVMIPLICFFQSSRKIMNYHKGKKIICNCKQFISKLYEESGKMSPRTVPSMSVATVAFSICVELGFQKIILVGQDLAYSGEQSHAGGVNDSSGTGLDIMVEGVNGESVNSRYDWKAMIAWFEDMLIVNPKLEVIDVKQHGAKIKGTKTMFLKHVLDNSPDIVFDIQELLNSMKPTFNQNEMISVKEYFKRSFTKLINIQTKSKDAIKICDTLIKECKKKQSSGKFINNGINKLGKINRFVEEQPVYTLIDDFVVALSAKHLAEINNVYDNAMENSLHAFEKSKSVYKSINEASAFAIEKMKVALDELNSDK